VSAKTQHDGVAAVLAGFEQRTLVGRVPTHRGHEFL
jgi:hypothetical protein